MNRYSLCAGALAAALAAAPPAAFRRYQDQRIEVDVPQGWETRWLNDRAFILSKDPRQGPALLLEVRPYMEKLDPRSMAGSVRSVLGPSFRIVDSRGSVTIFERANPATRVAALMHPDPQRRFSVTAIYWADAADYDSGGGLDLVLAVARSVSKPEPAGGARIVERTLGYAGPSQSSPETGSNATRVATGTVFEGDPSKPLPSSGLSAALLAGAWENTKLDSHLDTGRLDYSAEAGALGITFGANGDFQIRYRKMLISGVFRSETDVTETGRFTVDGGSITLRPESQQGWISVMNGRRQPLGPRGPARVYSIGVYGQYILLRGQCAPYQVDLGCGEDRGGAKRTLNFPFRRVR